MDCSLANSRRFSRGDLFFSLLTLFLVFPPSSILYSPISFYSLIFLFCFLEIIVEARKGRIHILHPTETDPGGARSRDPYPDSSCKITRVRALERRRVYSRKIALACTSQGTSMCIRCTYIYLYMSTIYLGKQGGLHENIPTYRIPNIAFAWRHMISIVIKSFAKNSFGK